MILCTAISSALGKINESNIDELLSLLQGQPAILWNLRYFFYKYNEIPVLTKLYNSGKPVSSIIQSKMNNQVVDNPWVTPGHFTQAPSLDCIFSLCYSIKSWLDLKKENIAILHCANGRSRTGILMACFLRYIGAFEHTSDAFDFFCATR